MYIPVVSKISQVKEVFIERVLPKDGEISVKTGNQVLPYDHLGNCQYSSRVFRLPSEFKPKKVKGDKKFYYVNSELGKLDKKAINAPFNGNLFQKEDGSYDFNEEEDKYFLLAGVWGVVDKVIEGKSVLIKASVLDLNLMAATDINFSGELVVFPNPSEVLEKHYLGEFSSDSAEGKIVYVGHNVSRTLLDEAVKQGWGGILAGSTDVDTFRNAKNREVSFGVFSGFGEISTPTEIFDLLNSVTNRYVFFNGDENILRIPVPPEQAAEQPQKKKVKMNPLKFVKKGIKVLVLQAPYYGQIGAVDRVTESSIFVKLPAKEKPVEIKFPNVFAVD